MSRGHPLAVAARAPKQTRQPDKNQGSAEASAKYVAIAKAYETILRADNRAAEADELLADPFADIFGAGWARAFAEGSADPAAVFGSARERLAAELGDDDDPLAAMAAEFGLDVDASELSQLLAGTRLGDGAPAEEGGDGSAPFGSDLGADNPIKDFFDALPEGERGQMLALFEKTFPAFLAQEMAETQLQAEDELFAHAVARDALPAQQQQRQRQRAGAQPHSSPGADVETTVEALNAEAVGAFNEGRHLAAADALTRAIALDPTNASLYGNRSLAHERRGALDDALADSERSLRCDPTYVAAYERKARALLGLGRAAEAHAAARRGRVLDADHAALADLEGQARRAADAAKLDLVRRGKDALGMHSCGVGHGEGGTEAAGGGGGGGAGVRRLCDAAAPE